MLVLMLPCGCNVLHGQSPFPASDRWPPDTVTMAAIIIPAANKKVSCIPAAMAKTVAFSKPLRPDAEGEHGAHGRGPGDHADVA